MAAQLSAYLEYVCPVRGTEAAMRQRDPALDEGKYIFPSAAMLRSGHSFKILNRAQIASYTAEFLAAVGL